MPNSFFLTLVTEYRSGKIQAQGESLMGDHAILKNDRRGWRQHDDHLKGMIRLNGDLNATFKAIKKNGEEIDAALAQIVKALRLQPSKSSTPQVYTDNTRAILNAPHNPYMTPAATRQHHKGVVTILRLLEKQVEQSGRVNKIFKELRRHQLALRNMFKR